MGLNGSRFALWSKTGGGTGFYLCQALTCFLFHQPDINWLWPLQVVYGKTDLGKKQTHIDVFKLFFLLICAEKPKK